MNIVISKFRNFVNNFVTKNMIICQIMSNLMIEISNNLDIILF